VRDRLSTGGLSDERLERVRVDGELVSDVDTPAPAGTRVVIW